MHIIIEIVAKKRTDRISKRGIKVKWVFGVSQVANGDEH